MRITALVITMSKIASLGAELPRAVAVLKEHCPAMETLNPGQILAYHLLRMCRPPCHPALRGAEPLLPMPGGLLEYSVALWATVCMNGCRLIKYRSR